MFSVVCTIIFNSFFFFVSLTTDDVLSGYSMKGLNGKKRFVDLCLCDVVTGKN